MSFLRFPRNSRLAASLFLGLSALLCAQGTPAASPVSRPEEERALVATLQSATSAEHEKVIACHRLAIIGTPASVPALAALLADPKFAHYARHALEPMPAPAAATALRDALARLSGTLLIGVVNSVGVRRDAQAIPALAGLLGHADAAVAAAAAAALGRIGSVDAARKLQSALDRATPALRLTLADASLTCAERLAGDHHPADAALIYDRLTGTDYPGHIRTAAMCGAITARRENGIALLVAQLKSQDPALLAAAWRAARELPGVAVTRALAAELAQLPAEKQLSLLRVFSDRGDPAAQPSVLAAMQSPAAEVRAMALQVLPRVDDGVAGQAILLRAVTDGRTPAETEAALGSLAQIAGADTNARILATLPTVPPPLCARLIGVLGARRADLARGELLRLAGGTDVEISKAAFRALAVIALPSDLPELIRLSVAASDDSVKVPADLAVYGVAMKIEPASQRTAPVLQAFRTATLAPVKCSVLRPLGALVKATGGSPEAFAAVREASQDSDAQVRDTALRTLAEWPDASPAVLLLDIVTRDPDPVRRELALRGGIRMASAVASGRDATQLDALAWLTRANETVRTNEEKLAIVSGLGASRQAAALPLLLPYLDDPAVQNEAALAVIELAQALVNTPEAEKLRPVLDKITRSTKDVDIRRKAGKTAKSLPAKK